METKETIFIWERLGKTLKRIEKHQAHKIDVDTAMQQVRELYEALLSMDKNMESPEVESPKEAIPELNDRAEENHAINPFDIIEDKTAVNEVVVEEGEEKEEIKEEEQIEENEETSSDAINSDVFIQNVEIPKKVEEKEKIETSVSKAEPKQSQPSLFQTDSEVQHESLGESLGKDKLSMNESIGKKENDLASKLQAKPVNDIKAAINLGDRFLFIKELFNGNADEFNQTIQDLNSIQSYDEAIKLLGKYDWDEENATVTYFQSIIQRKYMPKS
jgi:hypothetical protein